MQNHIRADRTREIDIDRKGVVMEAKAHREALERSSGFLNDRESGYAVIMKQTLDLIAGLGDAAAQSSAYAAAAEWLGENRAMILRYVQVATARRLAGM